MWVLLICLDQFKDIFLFYCKFVYATQSDISFPYVFLFHIRQVPYIFVLIISIKIYIFFSMNINLRLFSVEKFKVLWVDYGVFHEALEISPSRIRLMHLNKDSAKARIATYYTLQSMWQNPYGKLVYLERSNLHLGLRWTCCACSTNSTYWSKW